MLLAPGEIPPNTAEYRREWKPTQVPLHHGQSHAWPRPKKRTDSKKRAFFGAIWQKNGGPLQKKRHFFSCFFDF
jgi:hypothetical protein